ncbi:hypothetical protein [Bacillus sp. CHD6a]|uniref:hypothetical protein n=1 Tax=Bacillus sp. CHD6a TaxID=1643452 RepID=UPI0006CCD7D5|nr:hypothetical protein [Bacillus sp. CHD6a]KPB04543.1 hypothetical protein AAV98_11505 [Bacillus sp. CHD6a]
MKNDIDSITTSYLRLQTPKENRSNIIVFLLIFLDLIAFFPILAVPFNKGFLLAALIPTIFIHIWACLYIIAPYKYERSYYLFFGVYGIINSYVLFLSIQKILYSIIGVEGYFPFILGLILLIALLLVMNIINIKVLYSGTYARLQNMEYNHNTSPYLTAAGIGYVLSQLFLTLVYDNSIKMLFYIFLLSFFSIVTAYFSIFIHRYIFILKNYETVKKVNPEFGLPKAQRKTYQKKKK